MKLFECMNQKEKYNKINEVNVMKYMMFYSLLIVSLVANTTLAQQSAIVLNNTQILDMPTSSATVVSSVNKDTMVSLLKRKGGWYQIETEALEVGWLRMLKVRFLSEQESNEKSIAKILRETAVMPPASGISTGVRGLSDEALTHEESNTPIKFEQLKNFIPAEESIIKFAEEGKLMTQESVVLPSD